LSDLKELNQTVPRIIGSHSGIQINPDCSQKHPYSHNKNPESLC